MKASNNTFIQRNAAAISALTTYSLCLFAVLLLREWFYPLTTVMVCIGIAGMLLWAGFRSVVWLKAVNASRRRLCLSGIEKALRARGMETETAGEKQVLFRHYFNGVQWTAQYEEETGRLVIGLVFPLDNSTDVEVVKNAASEVMSKHRMVRLYLKSQGERLLFFLTIETFLTLQTDFNRFFDRYLELIVAAMKEHDALCRNAAEAKQTKERPKIGFVSPMREKIAAFDKANPDATEAERSEFIESLRR